MKLIKTANVEGTALYHDITQIVKGVTKDAAFRRGHVVTKGDIPVFLSAERDQLHVWEKEGSMLYEDETAEVLCAMRRGDHMDRSQAKEGKTEPIASRNGLLKVGDKGSKTINGFGRMTIATRYGNFTIKKGDELAGIRIIPLIIEEEKMEAAQAAASRAAGGKPTLELIPFVHKRVGIVTTGNRVFHGRIKDTFTPVIEEKTGEFDTEAIDHVIWDDDDTKVIIGILGMVQKGADVVICAGGMSADPGDEAPLAIKSIGVRIVSYGAPMLPGATFLLAYHEVIADKDRRTVTIVGLPRYAVYAKRAIFGLVLPRIMADDEVTAEDLTAPGQGGLCLSCPVCTFPNRGFDKGLQGGNGQNGTYAF